LSSAFFSASYGRRAQRMRAGFFARSILRSDSTVSLPMPFRESSLLPLRYPVKREELAWLMAQP